MSDFDSPQPYLGPLRAAAENAELANAVSGLVSAYGCRLAGSDPLAPLARHIARSVTEAAIGCVLRAFGYDVEPFGSGGAWLVTDRSHQDAGAGR